MQVQEESLKEEIALTNETYTIERYGKIPSLSVSLDMGW